ncbi:MAG: 50S ribosomal protein L35ae [Candidatus Odinarchaeia archaeon]
MSTGETSLSELKGIRSKVIENLENAGFNSIEKLAKASVEELKKIPGIGVKTAEKLINQSKEILKEKKKVKEAKKEAPAPPSEVIEEIPEIIKMGVLFSYRRGGYTQNNYEGLIKVQGVENKAQASQLIGKKVLLEFVNKVCCGKIISTHGNSGVLRVKFKKGLPGQALGKPVKII